MENQLFEPGRTIVSSGWISLRRATLSLGTLLFLILSASCQIAGAGVGMDHAISVCDLHAHDGPIQDIAFGPEGSSLLTAGRDGRIIRWSIVACEQSGIFSTEEGWPTSIAYGIDGGYVLAGTVDGEIVVLDGEDLRAVSRYRAHEGAIVDIAVANDGSRFATAALDGMARIWAATTSTVVLELQAGTPRVNSIDFNYDDSLIVTSHGGDSVSDMVAIVWDGRTGDELARMLGHRPFSEVIATRDPVVGEEWSSSGLEIGDVNCARFSPDGRNIATVSYDGFLKTWDSETGSPIEDILAHEATIYSVAYSPDGKWILTTSEEGDSKLWDASSLSEVSVLEGHQHDVTGGAFDIDSQYAATIGYDGTLLIWLLGE